MASVAVIVGLCFLAADANANFDSNGAAPGGATHTANANNPKGLPRVLGGLLGEGPEGGYREK